MSMQVSPFLYKTIMILEAYEYLQVGLFAYPSYWITIFTLFTKGSKQLKTYAYCTWYTRFLETNNSFDVHIIASEATV